MDQSLIGPYNIITTAIAVIAVAALGTVLVLLQRERAQARRNGELVRVARQLHRRYDALQRVTAEGVVVQNRDGVVVDMSERATQVLGVPRDRAVGLNATVQRVACGAADTVPYLMVTNLARTMRSLKDRGVWLVGTDDQATDSMHKIDARQPMAWVMGAEGEGMRRLTRETCDQLVNIPMLGSVESLNVSVASAVCLYETVRQRQS